MYWICWSAQQPIISNYCHQTTKTPQVVQTQSSSKTHSGNKAQRINELSTVLSPHPFLHLLFLVVCLLQTMAALHWGLYIGMMDEGICLTQGPVFSVPMPMPARHSSESMVIHTNDNKQQLKVSWSWHNCKNQREEKRGRGKEKEKWQERLWLWIRVGVKISPVELL